MPSSRFSTPLIFELEAGRSERPDPGKRRLVMAIAAERDQVADRVVARVAVDVVKLERHV
jgi:hypothetical protein